jgi:hypothetical protein
LLIIALFVLIIHGALNPKLKIYSPLLVQPQISPGYTRLGLAEAGGQHKLEKNVTLAKTAQKKVPKLGHLAPHKAERKA